MVSGLSIKPLISAKNDNLVGFQVSDIKPAGTLIVNYPAEYLGLAQSLIVDNQDGGNAVTVRINRGITSITVPASQFRAFNDVWIEQIDLTGVATPVQISAIVVNRDQLKV